MRYGPSRQSSLGADWLAQIAAAARQRGLFGWLTVEPNSSEPGNVSGEFGNFGDLCWSCIWYFDGTFGIFGQWTELVLYPLIILWGILESDNVAEQANGPPRQQWDRSGVASTSCCLSVRSPYKEADGVIALQIGKVARFCGAPLSNHRSLRRYSHNTSIVTLVRHT